MPSSLIVVALAAAWLVVLVPMVARKRQEIVRTTDSALAARVVRSGDSGRNGVSNSEREEFAMSASKSSEFDPGSDGADRSVNADSEPTETDSDLDMVDDHADGAAGRFADDSDIDDIDDMDNADSADGAETGRGPSRDRGYEGSRAGSPYRPGRGGFDPEAAEIAARAKYVHRQRIVLGLIVAAILTAFAAGFVWSMLWWVHGAIDIGLVGYLAYLRRQVRIENEIRQRRLAKYNRNLRAGSRSDGHDEADGHYSATRFREHADDRYSSGEADGADGVGQRFGASSVVRRPQGESEDARVPSSVSRIRQHAVVVDLEDEDPAFHELNEPAQPFRRAAGE